MIIAIDGSAASGKGTLAKRLAAHFGLSHLDTGALYRAVGLQLLNAGKNPENIDESQCIKSCFEFDITLTTSPLIRSEKVAEMASVVAAIPAVRSACRSATPICRRPPNPNGAVLDGRDIGTLVLPDADIKFFIDADINTRADRRTKELLQSGQSVMYCDVLTICKNATKDRSDQRHHFGPLMMLLSSTHPRWMQML